MFCPNCGKDCGSAKFCPECGQKLQGKPEKEQKSSVWSVGMPCPHCGGTRLDGGCCAFCGAQLVLNEEINPNAEDDSFVLPELNVGLNEVVDLNEGSFTHLQYAMFSRKCDAYVVPYAQIESITYSRKDSDRNSLIIVDKSGTRTTKISPLDKAEIVYQLFCFLKTVIPSSAEIIVEENYLSDDVSDKWMKRFDTDIFFATYNPYQKRARKKIMELTGLTVPKADFIAAKVICGRQIALYEANPSLAIRDLNRVIREDQREREEKRREREERSEARRRRWR